MGGEAGPGCSSVGVGALLELGPFFSNYNGTGLVRNEHSWNKLANIVFVESPAFVGFSYSNTSSDYSFFSDDLTAKYNLAFTLGWFVKFPEYKKNEFYLTGESFAGHYVPELAQQILSYNEQSTGFKINFKGDAYSDNIGATDFYHSHSLISDETYKKLRDNCDFAYDLLVDNSLHSATCLNTSNYALDVVMRKINIYNIYVEEFAMCRVTQCVDTDGFVPTTSTRYWIAKLNLPIETASLIQVWYPHRCMSLHCCLSFPVYCCCNLHRSEPPAVTQVGGWSQIFTNLTFATIREAGHAVPEYQPGRAPQLFKHFLKGQSLPTFNYTNYC
uniref:Carboxypeptidase n=1 Tax=Physcomitrium patens TaxID=3218 RepID=A0A2K1IB76_PHYPA|nr:hypothetical protein PHYPA_031094 [Physcomitrium patens]